MVAPKVRTGPFGHQGVEADRQLRARGLLNMYSQYRRSFLPAFNRQRPFGLVKEEGTPRLQSGGASTGFGYISDIGASCSPSMAPKVCLVVNERDAQEQLRS